jgi:predicted ATPase
MIMFPPSGEQLVARLDILDEIQTLCDECSKHACQHYRDFGKVVLAGCYKLGEPKSAMSALQQICMLERYRHRL